jgi:sulfur carrier protein
MRVLLNGEQTELADGVTVRDLIAELDLTKKRVAVEINREIVAREEFAARAIREGDVVEIVHFIGGG